MDYEYDQKQVFKVPKFRDEYGLFRITRKQHILFCLITRIATYILVLREWSLILFLNFHHLRLQHLNNFPQLPSCMLLPQPLSFKQYPHGPLHRQRFILLFLALSFLLKIFYSFTNVQLDDLVIQHIFPPLTCDLIHSTPSRLAWSGRGDCRIFPALSTIKRRPVWTFLQPLHTHLSATYHLQMRYSLPITVYYMPGHVPHCKWGPKVFRVEYYPEVIFQNY